MNNVNTNIAAWKLGQQSIEKNQMRTWELGVDKMQIEEKSKTTHGFQCFGGFI